MALTGPLLVLLAHGSRDPDWLETFEDLARRVESRLGAGRVRLAYLELASPGLEETIRRAADDGWHEVRVLPLFLAAGAHVKEDVPRLIGRLRAELPRIRIVSLPTVGDDRRLLDLLAEIAVEASEPRPPPRSAAGTSPGR